MKKAVLFLLLAIMLTGISYAGEIKIDGKCDEWQEILPLKLDERGDVGNDDAVDYMQFWLQLDNENYYFSYLTNKIVDWNKDAWRCNIFIDTDNDIFTGFCGIGWKIGAEFMVQGGTLYKFIGGKQNEWMWEKITMLAYSVDGKQVEICLPKININNPNHIKMILHGDNQEIADYVM